MTDNITLTEEEDDLLHFTALALAQAVATLTDLDLDDAVHYLTTVDPKAQTLVTAVEVASDLQAEHPDEEPKRLLAAAAVSVGMKVAEVYLELELLNPVNDLDRCEDLADRLASLRMTMDEATA